MHGSNTDAFAEKAAKLPEIGVPLRRAANPRACAGMLDWNAIDRHFKEFHHIRVRRTVGS
jgi:hypothetical protein